MWQKSFCKNADKMGVSGISKKNLEKKWKKLLTVGSFFDIICLALSENGKQTAQCLFGEISKWS